MAEGQLKSIVFTNPLEFGQRGNQRVACLTKAAGEEGGYPRVDG